MTDVIFQCDPAGPVGERIRVRYRNELIGQGLCYPSGAVDFTFDSSLSRVRRHELEKLFENRARIRGKYHPNIETKNPDGTKTILMDGSIEIFLSQAGEISGPKVELNL